MYLTLFLFISCSSSTKLQRPEVEAISYGTPDFNGIVSSYYSTDIDAQAKDPNVIIFDPYSPKFTGPRFTQSIYDQAAVKKVMKGFTCPVRGTVSVAIILDSDGTIKAPQLRRGIHTLCDAKAIEVIKKATIHPAKWENKPIALVITYPFVFR